MGLEENHLKKRAFIAAFRKALNMKAAAKAAKIETKEHYDWLRGDAYRKAWEAVQEELAQSLEDEAVRRAMEGVQRPVLYRGKVVRTGRGRNSRILYDTEYSDQLMIVLLKRFRPELYRERTLTEVSGSVDIIERLQAGRQRVLAMRTEEPAAG